MRASRTDARVPSAHRVLERPAITTQVSAAGLAERRCEPTQIDDRTGTIRQRLASMTVDHAVGKPSPLSSQEVRRNARCDPVGKGSAISMLG